MKTIYVLLALCACHGGALAQLSNGGLDASFGVDADTKAGYLKYGSLAGFSPSDDWFSSAASSGNNVIDTSNAAYYKAQLQSGANISFFKRMPVPLYSKVSGKIWLDAVYVRDYIVNTSNDSTAFTGGAKNGDDPANWKGGVSAPSDKNDLVDVFAHMRRDGESVEDSLWFFTGATTTGTSGARYYDIELYRNNISYNPSTGKFTTGGPDAGHTQWAFDAAGNITQTGDMIVAVNFSPGSAPAVDIRIWVSQSTFSTITPKLFKFGGSFDGSTSSFGYASILTKSGATNFGSGISNYSATASADTTYATPWGSEGVVSGTKQWVSQYQSQQFVEVGLNLTRIGVDPALYTALDSSACSSTYSSVFFKSRSSNSFTSNLQDFVGPLDFLSQPVMDYTLATDTLSCNQPQGTIQVSNNTTAGYYTWTTSDGSIVSANSDSTTLNIDKAGTYILQASPAQGCTVTRRDTLTILSDDYRPSASILVGSTPDLTHYQFYGGDTAASNYATPFGYSQGLTWDWSGPKGFTASIQNPINDTTSGTYQLIVTEQRNGCKDTAVAMVSFSPLADRVFGLKAIASLHAVALQWHFADAGSVRSFGVEKRISGNDFLMIGKVPAKLPGGGTEYSFTDPQPSPVAAWYRIKAIAGDGRPVYSAIVRSDPVLTGGNFFHIRRNGSGALIELVAAADTGRPATLAIYDVSGRLLARRHLLLHPGVNDIPLPVDRLIPGQWYILSVGTGQERPFVQKFSF